MEIITHPRGGPVAAAGVRSVHHLTEVGALSVGDRLALAQVLGVDRAECWWDFRDAQSALPRAGLARMPFLLSDA
jgi:hypothetical protein